MASSLFSDYRLQKNRLNTCLPAAMASAKALLQDAGLENRIHHCSGELCV
jgi:hypothetical protein